MSVWSCFQTLRTEIEKWGVAKFFNKSLETWSNTSVSVWYSFSKNMYFRRKWNQESLANLCKCLIMLPNPSCLWFSFVLALWIINEFEKVALQMYMYLYRDRFCEPMFPYWHKLDSVAYGNSNCWSLTLQEFGYTHLSAGDLLRIERASGSKHGDLIENCMKEGTIVPVEITISLIEKVSILVCTCMYCLCWPKTRTMKNFIHVIYGH